MKRSKWNRLVSHGAVWLCGSSTMALNACNGDLGTEFRDAVGDSFRQGVQTIAAGLIDGAFVIFDPDPNKVDGAG